MEKLSEARFETCVEAGARALYGYEPIYRWDQVVSFDDLTHEQQSLFLMRSRLCLDAARKLFAEWNR